MSTAASSSASAGGPRPAVGSVVPTPVPSGTAVEFAQAARVLGREARHRGLVVPGFRSPPRIIGVQRTLRRHAGGAVVAVQVRGRPWFAVVADMIEGVVVANQLQAPNGDRLRTELWEALGYGAPVAPAVPLTSRSRRAAPAVGARAASPTEPEVGRVA